MESELQYLETQSRMNRVREAILDRLISMAFPAILIAGIVLTVLGVGEHSAPGIAMIVVGALGSPLFYAIARGA